MAKTRSTFVCQNCGYESTGWMGRCPDCGSWNTLVEEQRMTKKPSKAANEVRLGGGTPQPIDRLSTGDGQRVRSDIGELDRVLGGGIVRGSLVLIGGDPGVGKSTLLLQLAHNLACKHHKVLYVSGEESASQTKMRAERIGALSENLLVLAETRFDNIEEHIRRTAPALCVIDSVQTVYTSDIQSAPGSVAQVREVATRALACAKSSEIPVFLVGHITKSGAIAGPRVLEHIVDTVLYFEGDRSLSYRILRAVKNRFGSTNEIGVFEMADSGLLEVENPSEIFLSGRSSEVPGSAVAVCVEGTRPLLVEVQSLVAPTRFGMPRRMASGIDHNRLGLLLAVLEKRADLSFGSMDVYLKIAGGLRVDEPAVDLAVAIAASSALCDRQVDADSAFLGEIGLGGEIRAVARVEQRLSEAARMGFGRCFIPQANVRKLERKPASIEIVAVKTVRDAVDGALSG